MFFDFSHAQRVDKVRRTLSTRFKLHIFYAKHLKKSGLSNKSCENFFDKLKTLEIALPAISRVLFIILPLPSLKRVGLIDQSR